MDTQLARATVSIREMILRGRLHPGQRVAEAMLAEVLNMSRTPVRQALPVLAKEGLLVESGTRGYVVRTFTQSEEPRASSSESCAPAWNPATASSRRSTCSTPMKPPTGT